MTRLPNWTVDVCFPEVSRRPIWWRQSELVEVHHANWNEIDMWHGTVRHRVFIGWFVVLKITWETNFSPAIAGGTE